MKYYIKILALLVAIFLPGCTSPRHYDFSLKNTLAIFMLNNEKDNYFCIPVQYMGDYQLGNFDFNSGFILIGDYEILLKRDGVNISVFLNETADEDGNSDSGFTLIYLEEKGEITISKMNEPLAPKHETADKMNHYYIFIERFLDKDEVKKITSEYEKGNVFSRMCIEYDLVIDNEPQLGSGMMDDFELYDGVSIDPALFPPNLNFFKAKYLKE